MMLWRSVKVQSCFFFILFLTAFPPALIFGQNTANNADEMAPPPLEQAEATGHAVAPAILPPSVTSAASAGDKMPYIETIPDPHEFMNRGMFSFDKGFLKTIGLPVANAYQVIPEGGRQSIRKMGENLGWPVRFFNTMFQGKFIGTGVETSRFLINTTVGIVGLFDPASHIGLEPYKADFGQTLAFYGSSTGNYYVLPFIGPNCRRDTIGWFFDTILNPTTYIPGAGIIFNLNSLSFQSDSLGRMMKSECDLYPLARDLWTINRKKNVTDFQILDYETQRTQTLEAIFLNVRNPEFAKKAMVGKAFIKSTQQKLPYLYWMQDRQAPLIFVLPGVGSSRLSGSSMALAEMVYANGYSVALVSNALNWEFMERASTAAVPGYTPTDAMDVYKALNAIYLDLHHEYAGQFKKTALMGISLGALHTLFIASQQEKRQTDELRFDRYLAINPPVDLPYALQKLDSFYDAPLAWPAAEREEKIWNTLLKAVKTSEVMSQGTLTPTTELAFDKNESEFLIGLNFKLILRDIIYSSQSRKDLGVLPTNLNSVRRNAAYKEIMGYSYTDFLNSFVIPYYQQKSGGSLTHDQLLASASMPAIGNDLKSNAKVRVYLNQNDFLLRPPDIDWMKSVLDEKRLHIFSEGGHLGNLYKEPVQNRILEPLEDLKEKL